MNCKFTRVYYVICYSFILFLGRAGLRTFKGRQGSDEWSKLLFASGYKFSVPLGANLSVEVVTTRKSSTLRNFPCTVLQCPVVLTSLKASLVSTTV